MQKGITNRQMFFIIIFTLISLTVVSLPKKMAETAGTGAWFSILLTCAFFCIAILILSYLGYKFTGKTLFEYSKLLVGKGVTYIFVAVYIVYFFGITSLINRLASEVIKADFLPKTPIWAITFILLITSSYAASKGITNLGRLLEFYGPIILIVAIAIHTLMFFYGDFRNILPLYEPSEKINYMKGSLTAVVSFLGFEVLTVIPMTKTNGKKAMIYSVAGVIVVGVTYVYIVESAYSIVGVDDIVNYRDALVVAIRRIDAAFLQFLQRMDLVFIIVWVMAVFCSLSVFLYTVNEYIKTIFKRANSKLTLIILTVLIYIGGLIPKTYETASEIIEFIANYLGIITSFLIPFVLFIVFKVKNYAKN